MNVSEQKIRLLVVNGVNLGRLGTREINVYGSVTFEEHLAKMRERYPQAEITHFQSDIEGELAEALTSARNLHGIILNAGAFTHTSVALADAVRAARCPVVEVHISNIFGREQYRRTSLLSAACAGFISGFGLQSYDLAVESFLMKFCAKEIKPQPI